jgi:hypothetical protein
MGIAGLGALFNARVDAAGGAIVGIVAGVNAVALVAAIVALAAGLVAWPLLGSHRSQDQ